MSVQPSSDRLELAADDGARLVGTVTFPDVVDQVPAALLVNGSGPLDRDSNMPGQALDVASSLADSLAARGVASLRFDKRGVGESEGEYLTTSFDRETDDAAAALVALRDIAGVDPERITIVGHSVGATIAIRLAARYEWLAGVVLLAAATTPGVEVMRIQSERIAGSLRGLQRLGARLLPPAAGEGPASAARKRRRRSGAPRRSFRSLAQGVHGVRPRARPVRDSLRRACDHGA